MGGGGGGERRKIRDWVAIFDLPISPTLPYFTVDLHNSPLSLAACGSEERRMAAGDLE